MGGADQRADRRRRDGDRLPSHFVERFEHGDMGEPAGPAPAKRERKGLLARKVPGHRAPASHAKSQAVAASGRTSGAMSAAVSLAAVPSRTRPTMPCRIAARRKKL